MWAPEFDYLWAGPNLNEYAIPFWVRAYAILEGWSEVFFWRQNFDGRTVGLEILHPSDVKVAGEAGGVRRFKLYGEEHRTYGADEIIHIMGLSWDGKRGVPPVRAATLSHQIAGLQDRFVRTFLRKGANPSGVVSTPSEWDDEALAEFYDGWDDQHGGVAGAGSVVVMQGGATYQPISIHPVDAQLLESRHYSREEVLGCYAPGLPHHLVGWRSNTSNFGTGLEQQNKQLLSHVFKPRQDLVRSVLAEVLLPPELALGYDVEQWLEGDAKTQAEVWSKARQGGVVSREEWRAKMGLAAAPIPDDFWLPKNVRSIAAAGGRLQHEDADSAP